MTDDISLAQPLIATKRLHLRPVRRSDAGLLGVALADRRVAHQTRTMPHPMPPGAIDALVERATCPKRSEFFWVMDGVAAGLPEVAGMLHVEVLDRAQSELSFWVAPGLWNSGLASEASTALLIENPTAARTFFAAVFQDNPASAQVLTNQGFVYLGDAETYCVARDSKLRTWTYSLTLD